MVKKNTEVPEIQDEESEKRGTPPYSPHFSADLHQIWLGHYLGEYNKGNGVHYAIYDLLPRTNSHKIEF